MKLTNSKSGLVLAEALMAVALLAVGAIIMGAVIQSGVSSTRIAKEYLLAQNLVTEGIESVKTIRNTNWLRNPLEPECWLRANPEGTSDCAESLIYKADLKNKEEMSFISMEADNGLWILKGAPGNSELDIDLESSENNYTLWVVEEETDAGVLFNRYTTDPTDADPSPYYRGIKFLHADNDMAIFEVKVQWVSESTVKTIARQVQLFNYLNP